MRTFRTRRRPAIKSAKKSTPEKGRGDKRKESTPPPIPDGKSQAAGEKDDD